MNQKLDDFFTSADKWQEELTQLRRIILSCGLVEELKWGQACYTLKNANVLIIGGFKNYCIISFFKGALLSDTQGLLREVGKNTQAARSIHFTSVKEIIQLEAVLIATVFEAIEIEKLGLKIETKSEVQLEIPQELQNRFDADIRFKNAFFDLSAGRQKAYILHFSDAKQSKTRMQRIEKYHYHIMNGFGLYDCTCGLTKKKPNCDGSHKFLHHF